MNAIPNPQSYSVAYRCGRCGEQFLQVIYQQTGHEQVEIPQAVPFSPLRGSSPSKRYRTIVTEVMKVGQFPPLSVAIPKGLVKGLGTDATALYRKALISRNNGYGLAAVGYMRRVVEDKTNELIETAAEYAESFGSAPQEVEKLRSAISPDKYIPYEDKLSFASTVFPENLKVGSVNPLQLLFTGVSKGLHGLGEPECIDVADGLREVFEYVFEKLKAEIADRRTFVERVKKLTA